MVKFSKELQSQLVPEWQEAYCAYAELKNDLKRIQQHRTMGPTYTRSGTSLGILRSIASTKAANLTKTFTRTFSRAPSPRGRPDYMASLSVKPGVHSKDIIAINKRKTEDGDVYMTELREPISISPQDITYFARLDAQLTKVNKFYKKKETENIVRAGVLEKKMYELIHAQEAVARQGIPVEYATPLGPVKQDHDAHMTGHHMQNPKELSDELPLISEDTERSESFLMEASAPAGKHQEDDDDDGEIDDAISRYIVDQTASKNLKTGSAEHRSKESAASGSILKLRSAMKATSSVVPDPVDEDKELEYIRGDDDVESQKTYTQKELDEAKRLLRRAFVDFYRSLSLLSSYRSVNITAFAKITKKYDEITGWAIAPIYMKEVESSYFVTSKKIHKLATKVEDIYIKHFADGERKKAMAQLRPVRRQGTHRTTFFLGLFSGSSIALLVSFFFLVSNPLALKKGGGIGYLNTVFPVFSTLMLVAIHMYFYGWNVYAWQRTRINYPFIFEFSPGTELRFREVLLLSTGFTTFLLAGMNIHIAVTLLTYQDPQVSPGVALAPSALNDTSTAADVIPLILVLTSLLALFFPFNILYRSSRKFFLGCFRRLVIAPLIKVKLSDFFLGDQFTSQVLVFRNLEYVTCYYSSGFFLTNEQDHVCKKNSVYQGFGYVVALLPYWWRFLQCLRRWIEEKDVHQRDNAAKYMSAIVAVGLRQAYTNYRKTPSEVPLLVLMIVASIVATIFTNYWDLCIDWGLLNKQSKNKWLRDKIILKNKSLYFIAMGTNSVLRLAWLATLIQAPVSLGLNQNAFDVCMAVLEILRRGIWNFFRIENEHLTNVGKYRAEKAVPLPFNDEL
ncbi:hypothetical protein M758_9G122400 [Ceratodon purpureus]|nr:hypothetical protein M758_9G122400 [Ceratodon purpureus]